MRLPGGERRYKVKTYRGVLLIVFLLALWPGMAVAAQDRVTAVMPFAGDDPALSSRIRDAAIAEVGNMEGFTPQSLDAVVSQPDAPPDSALVPGMPYALTGEYYFDDEDMQHFQLWLWNSESGSLVYTDELVAEDVEEAEGYLPRLVSWVFSKIPVAEMDTEVTQAVQEAPAEASAVQAEERGTGEQRLFPRLYLGLGIGGGLDNQFIRPTGNYEGAITTSFGGEAAVSVEFRPWRILGFQAEGIIALESFAPFRVQNQSTGRVHGTGRYTTWFLRFPLLVKVHMDLGEIDFSLLGGPYYALSPREDTKGDKPGLPLGFMAGVSLAYPLGPGEIFGGIRYDIDMRLSIVEESGLQYRRGRLAISAGYRFLVIGKKAPGGKR
jgi:hypothetical protein